VPPLHSLLIYSRTFISIQTDLLEFIKLQQPLRSRRLQIKIEVLDDPIRSMFQLYEEVMRLTMDELEWGGVL